MELEVCAYSLASCLTAELAGAHRIELCGGRLEGGITPSAGLIQRALKVVKIPIVVMIRPRGGDFLYNEIELEVMKADILHCKALGVKEIIFGVLKSDGSLNVAVMRELLKLASPMKVVLHRAFDMTVNHQSALEDAIGLGCIRILTSGGQNVVIDGLEMLKKLSKQAAGRIEIMAGSGVDASNVAVLIDCGVDAIHLSGSNVFESQMVFRNPTVSMASSLQQDEYQRVETDLKKIKAVASIIQNK